MVEPGLEDGRELGVVEAQVERLVDEAEDPLLVRVVGDDEVQPVEVPVERLVLDAVLGGHPLRQEQRSCHRGVCDLVGAECAPQARCRRR